MGYEQIAKELRCYVALLHYKGSAARARLDEMLDNIDAIHRSLEEENESLREREQTLITLLRNDCDIDVSWDGLRKFWNIGLTEYGCLMRDRACKAEAENERLRDASDRDDDWPLDADGVPICVGDMLAEGEASPERVKALMFDRDGWSVNFGFGWCGMKYYEWHHAKPDTWERIIEDAREYSLNIGGSYLWKNKSDELIARCKALAGEDE